MTTTEYLQREILRTELSIRRAERKPNTPPEELRGLHEKLEHLQEALKAVGEHWQRVHEQRVWTAGEPLTLEQIRGMRWKPVYVEDKRHPKNSKWAMMHEELCEAQDWTYFLDDYGDAWLAYTYPPARIDRERWVECPRCRAENREPLGYDGADDAVSIVIGNNAAAIEADSFGFTVSYCPKCGRPLTEEAWAELERRVFSE